MNAHTLTSCPNCRGSRLPYLFSIAARRVVRCHECGLMMRNPQLADEPRSALPRAGAAEKDNTARPLAAAAADRCLDLLERYHGGAPGGQLLEIGCSGRDLPRRASARGYQITSLTGHADACEPVRRWFASDAVLPGAARVVQAEVAALATNPDEEGRYDACVMSDVIGRVHDPRAFLEHVHRLLRPGGAILIFTPDLNAESARPSRGQWMETESGRLFYFDSATLGSLLFHTGFGETICHPDKATRESHLGLAVAGGSMMMARAMTRRVRRKLSVIVPIYNEAATVKTALDRLLAKEVGGLDMEFILVESNSVDGTREIVQRYAGRPGVRVVLEDQPRGKGHAVRAGFQQATGDFILIQDADLEYDLEDYEQLLEPLVAGWNSFVLGARHGGRAWKMRQFNGQPFVAAALNGAHRFFTGLFNVAFGVRLKDPFTMYKVFRRDCLHGLEFECERFDFDLELLFRLVQAGHRPVEVPVNYRSRSFKEGKKVSVLRDPVTWLRAALRCRLSPPDPLAAVERARAVLANLPDPDSARASAMFPASVR